MNKQGYAELVEKELEKIKAIIQAKNHDYTGGEASAFANFESTPELASPFSGVLIRMGDKFQRLKTYASKGTLQVAGEGAEDAARDMIGYSLILLGMLADAKPVARDRNTHITEYIAQVAEWRKKDRVRKPVSLKAGKSYRTARGDIINNLQIVGYNAGQAIYRGINAKGHESHTFYDNGFWYLTTLPEHPDNIVEEVG
jgi:hypothetical protein